MKAKTLINNIVGKNMKEDKLFYDTIYEILKPSIKESIEDCYSSLRYNEFEKQMLKNKQNARDQYLAMIYAKRYVMSNEPIKLQFVK